MAIRLTEEEAHLLKKGAAALVPIVRELGETPTASYVLAFAEELEEAADLRRLRCQPEQVELRELQAVR